MKYVRIIIDFLIRDTPIHLINLVTVLLPNHLITNRIRGGLIRPFLGKCGRRLQIGKGVIINNPRNLRMGNDCYISHYCYVQAKGGLEFGDNVIIGPMSIIATSNHIFEKGVVKNKGSHKPIVIGKGTWCGGHVVITSGVNIGESVVVAAGAVVTKDVISNKKVAGVPAKEITSC
ncbi:maltose O-acetyltransferase [Desulfotomaculum arcticum]|uniref:Maltose O-acetyltransferase n=1 Tax=Desulfotruncus arcticus DSM 17038 TaxID=1121424 RepID=A0A1I2X3L0_9FIRM|nr:acyltransferase [Desulfotruncus arcticus]SFH07617.1 maltose O-acetyltransferase [Desulfotomaculum arcticum] [Desulfotruncus arcticus DSM 17038]